MNDKDNVMDAAIEYCSGNKGADARVRAGFIIGAHWQEERLIDKACEWLKAQEEMIGISFQEDFIERFRKAMEG